MNEIMLCINGFCALVQGPSVRWAVNDEAESSMVHTYTMDYLSDIYLGSQEVLPHR